jgi:dTDP-glucose 4,6-dehydratase
MLLILLLGVVTVVTAEKQVCQQNPGSEAACGEFKKTALVTGGAGFVGHSIIENLLDTTDWNIIALNRLDFSGKINRVEEILKGKDEETKHRVKILYGDLKAEINPQVVMEIGQVNYIIHVAAGSSVDRSIEAPTEFLWDNVVGTVNLLEFARLHQKNLDRFIYFSTCEVYGPAPKGVVYNEYDRYNSPNPYAAAKAAAEEFAVSYENTYKMPIVIARTMNVYGDRQAPWKYMPSVFTSVKEGKTVTIHGDPTGKTAGSRRYIHVKDVADAVRFILHLPKEYKHKGEYGGGKCPKFNLVGQEEIDNLSLAKIIAESMGKELKHQMVDFHSTRPGHDLRLDFFKIYISSCYD